MSHEFWPGSPFEFMRAFDRSHNLILAAWIVSFGTMLNCFAWPVVLVVQWIVDFVFGTLGSSRAKIKRK